VAAAGARGPPTHSPHEAGRRNRAKGSRERLSAPRLWSPDPRAPAAATPSPLARATRQRISGKPK